MAKVVTELATEEHPPTKNHIKPSWFHAFGILFDNTMVDIISVFISKRNHSFFTGN